VVLNAFHDNYSNDKSGKKVISRCFFLQINGPLRDDDESSKQIISCLIERKKKTTTQTIIYRVIILS